MQPFPMNNAKAPTGHFPKVKTYGGKWGTNIFAAVYGELREKPTSE
jgi:hypothetical protein